jgi:hypothetical protein
MIQPIARMICALQSGISTNVRVNLALSMRFMIADPALRSDDARTGRLLNVQAPLTLNRLRLLTSQLCATAKMRPRTQPCKLMAVLMANTRQAWTIKDCARGSPAAIVSTTGTLLHAFC